MTDVRRLAELSMPTQLASEVAAQINGATSTKPAVVALAAIATADATDLASAITLANATKVKVNAIIAALKA
jgi:hypothetical protein